MLASFIAVEGGKLCQIFPGGAKRLPRPFGSRVCRASKRGVIVFVLLCVFCLVLCFLCFVVLCFVFLVFAVFVVFVFVCLLVFCVLIFVCYLLAVTPSIARFQLSPM